jgi:hypothetical protein
VGDAREQSSRIYAQAFKLSTTPREYADKAQSGFFGGSADRIPVNELSREATRQRDVPGFVALDAAEDRGDCGFSREDAVGLEQSGEDHANCGIKGRNRSEM